VPCLGNISLFPPSDKNEKRKPLPGCVYHSSASVQKNGRANIKNIWDFKLLFSLLVRKGNTKKPLRSRAPYQQSFSKWPTLTRSKFILHFYIDVLQSNQIILFDYHLCFFSQLYKAKRHIVDILKTVNSDNSKTSVLCTQPLAELDILRQIIVSIVSICKRLRTSKWIQLDNIFCNKCFFFCHFTAIVILLCIHHVSTTHLMVNLHIIFSFTAWLPVFL